MSTSKKVTLGDLGEFRVLREVVLPLARSADGLTRAGDDCAFVAAGGDTLAVTADVGPRPIIRSLAAHRDDWEASGWLAVVATASDVASAGARPLLLANCVDAPADLEVDVLARFMRGYFSAMTEFGFRNGGGDLRQGPVLAARVFGVGVLDGARRIGRNGARSGDRLVVVGPAGSFMAHYLLASEREMRLGVADAAPAEAAPDALRFPRPQLRAMRLLAERDLVRAASDTSDGLLGAIDNIASASGCGFTLELDDALLSQEVKDAAALTTVASPWNLFFAWGDWSVAAVVDGTRVEDFERCCREKEIDWRPLGWVVPEVGELTATLGGRRLNVTPVRNENFLGRGFNAGLEGHLGYVLNTPILTSKSTE